MLTHRVVGLRVTGLLLTALAAAAAHGADELHPATPPVVTFTPAITPDEVLARVGLLASEEFDGRETGTDGGRRAEDYVAAEFARMGLEALGEGDSSFQPVPLPSRMPLPDGSWIEIACGDAPPVRIGGAAGSMPFSFSKPGPAEGELVFAGFGITAPDVGYDDYAGLDVKGKVVLVLRHGPREKDAASPWNRPERRPKETSFVAKAKRAADAGAAAIVLVNDSHHGDQALPVASPGPAATVPVLAVSRSTADRLVAATGKSLAALQAEIDADMKPHSVAVAGTRVSMNAALAEAAGRNVVVVRRGTDATLRDEAVLVCAHLDHVGRGWFGSPVGGGQIHNGADDNASGTAALLEVAEAFAAGPPTKRSVIFAAWCAEEKGLVGSIEFTKKSPWPLAKVVACVNMDMVGRYRDATAEDGGLYVAGAPTGSGLEERVARLAQAQGLRATPTWDAWEQSDHYAFYAKDVPSVFVHTGLHDDYHRPGDDWWKIAHEPEARIARMVAELARETADAAERPAFQKRPPRPVLGVRLADAPGGKGARLVAVFPSFGAAAAGLQAEDVIVRYADLAVTSAADLSKQILASTPGTAVDVVYVRGGTEHAAKVVVSGR